jgi:hypothetical protein
VRQADGDPIDRSPLLSTRNRQLLFPQSSTQKTLTLLIHTVYLPCVFPKAASLTTPVCVALKTAKGPGTGLLDTVLSNRSLIWQNNPMLPVRKKWIRPVSNCGLAALPSQINANQLGGKHESKSI